MRYSPFNFLVVLCCFVTSLHAHEEFVTSNNDIAAAAPPPPPPSLFWGFDAAFGDNMVLQKAPASAAIYGYLDTASATGVSVTVYSNGTALYTVQAKLNVTNQPFGPTWGIRPCSKVSCPPYEMNTFTPFSFPLPTWKVLLPPTPVGGNYTIVAQCNGCNSTMIHTISNVIFGDVWYCAGQSNMMLWVSHSFTRNQSAQDISNGKYSNIRVMGGSSTNYPYATWPPNYGDIKMKAASNPWMMSHEAAPDGCIDKQNCPFFQLAAPCWYALQSIIDQGVDIPIGLINTALGGQRIEEFMENSTTASCTDLNSQNIPWWNSQLYGSYVLPFTDFSLFGWLWYQGENNVGGTKGNSLTNNGYACAMRELIRGWRAVWSKTPGTTDPLAPFGLVTLASSGSEGGPNFGTMRIAQTASYGVLPSPELPNTFLAQAYDLDDTWGPTAGPCFTVWACCKTNKAYNATKCEGRETLCQPACEADISTPMLMGGIHPRSKKEVGDRLGRAMINTIYGGSKAFTGPTLSSCSRTGNSLSIQFNETLLRGDTLSLQPLQRAGGSQLWVQTNASLFCMEPQCVLNQTSGKCDNINPANPRQGFAYYCPTYAGGDGVSIYSNNILDSGWISLNFTADASGTAVTVDLTPLGGQVPTAVKYAWGVVDCCDHTDPNLYVQYGCIAQCPIMSSSGLPANPFQAQITSEGTCKCVAPQVCG
jgi:hypothetical protein